MNYRPTGCSPVTTIADCLARDWAVHARCGVCGHRTAWTGELATLPPQATLGDLSTRMRCGVCGAMEGAIYTAQVRRGGGHSA